MKSFKKHKIYFVKTPSSKGLLTFVLAQFIIFVFLTYGCKKSALTGDNSAFVGEWVWKEGFDDNGNTAWRLVIKEKGKYKLTADGKKLEVGRIVKVGDKLECRTNALVPKGYLDKKNLILLQTNELKITRIEFTDQPISIFTKVK